MTPTGARKVLLSGMQPTNRLTIGNYLGALRNWVKFQDEYECLFPVVDLHAITNRVDPKQLHDLSLAVAATYIGGGVDPEKTAIFMQSHVPEHAELGWVITCHTYMGELNRMTQFKDKSAKAGANIPSGLFVYPSLMAADVLLYRTNIVPVGEDQKQHLELTRDVCQRMNNLYGDDLFVLPEIFIPKIAARVMDLQNPTAKMGKSDAEGGGVIFLHEPDKAIEKKIKRAVTDSGTEILFTDDKPGIKNLLSIQSAITGKTPEQLVKEYEGKQYGHLKVDTANIVVEHLRPVREKIEYLLNDRGELDRILKRGAEKARERARVTLDKVYERVGFVPRAH